MRSMMPSGRGPEGVLDRRQRSSTHLHDPRRRSSRMTSITPLMLDMPSSLQKTRDAMALSLEMHGARRAVLSQIEHYSCVRLRPLRTCLLVDSATREEGASKENQAYRLLVGLRAIHHTDLRLSNLNYAKCQTNG